MFDKNIFLAGLVAFTASAGTASAATATIGILSWGAGAGANKADAIAARDTFIGTQGPIIAETFEGFTACPGATCDSGTINSNVGTFTGFGGHPANPGGSQVDPRGEIVVRTNTPNPFRRFDVEGGSNWLDSNDLNGIQWDIPGASSLPALRKLAFFLTDVDDVGSVNFEISADGTMFDSILTGLQGRQTNGTLNLVTLSFSESVSDLQIRMTAGVGDGFGIDGIRVAAVPLPAAGLMLLGAIGGLGAMRMRKRKMAS